MRDKLLENRLSLYCILVECFASCGTVWLRVGPESLSNIDFRYTSTLLFQRVVLNIVRFSQNNGNFLYLPVCKGYLSKSKNCQFKTV